MGPATVTYRTHLFFPYRKRTLPLLKSETDTKKKNYKDNEKAYDRNDIISFSGF